MEWNKLVLDEKKPLVNLEVHSLERYVMYIGLYVLYVFGNDIKFRLYYVELT